MVKEFLYTLNNYALSNEQRRFYEENGYILIKKLIPDEYLDKCRDRFLEVCNGDTSNINTVLRVAKNQHLKKEHTISKIQDFMYDPTLFSNYIAHPEIIKVVTSVIGPNISAVNSMLINKPPDTDYKLSRHPLHQDQYYFPCRPSNRMVASWTAMEKINEDNGCLFVVPGTHKIDLQKHRYPEDVSKQYYVAVEGYDDVPKVNLLMEKGDTAFFHPLLLHGSGPNVSKGFRKAISVHYADSNSYLVEAKGTIQAEIEEEILKDEKRKGRIFKDLSDFLKHRSRMVSGNPGNLQNIYSRL